MLPGSDPEAIGVTPESTCLELLMVARRAPAAGTLSCFLPGSEA